ncbi:succinate-semialdehyde dehydrogenase (NADP+) [Kwoniella mangroviensis CBS 10435]|uniref:Succinate-semialdehyde dehydrogenase n=1 Tax=Kwoniella mangroviensis CBS 10435 TaxID=1331196 RepID=A0A1B9ITV0_9TREE|nr:succinate-semialdehyde dehydrogenase (NADP+) [Kwoniella mangroviensis CBS 10435]
MSQTQDLAVLLSDSDLFRSQGYINGQWVSASDGATFPLTNPATGAKLADMPHMPRTQVAEAIDAAKAALPSWSALTAYQRSAYLLKLHALMEQHVNDLGTILCVENGKPLAEAKGEIAYGASFMQWNAAEGLRTYGQTIPSPYPGTRNIVIKQPIGVCGLITPWNFPNAMITRKMAPALAAGCTVVIKAPAETPLSALAMAVLCERIGIPAGVVNVVVMDKGEKEAAAGLELCENPKVSKISFTGSTSVGRLLMKQSSSTLKKLSFELGGNAAFIIFDDADLETAVKGVIASKFRAAGQTCVCANRIFVHSKIYNEFASLLAEKVKELKVGNGMDEGVLIGPLVNVRGVEKVERHVQDAVSKGAKILVGGSRIKSENAEGESCFFQPTVLVDVPKECYVASEETFGPLAPLFKFDDEDDVVNRANSSEVGLAGYFFTKDLARSNRVAERLEVGMVGVNTGVIAQACIPFGGVKQSGFGREGGPGGINEFQIEKLITIGGI